MFRLNKEHKFHGRHRFLLAGILCLLAVCFLVAQDKKPQHDKKPQQEKKAEPEKPTGNKKTRVDLLHADRGQADKLARPDVQVLIGSVKLRHDSMYMYCDSALIYEKRIHSKHLAMCVWSREILFSSMATICFMTA